MRIVLMLIILLGALSGCQATTQKQDYTKSPCVCNRLEIINHAG